MFNNFENLFPMTPAQSWAFIGIIACGCFLFVQLLKYGSMVYDFTINNSSIVGFKKGFCHALLGRQLYEIRRERVLEVVRNPIGYSVLTTDGEVNSRYQIIPSREDEDNEDYRVACQLSGDNKKLLKELLPESRVKDFFSLRDKKTGAVADFFVVYLKYDNARDVESALENLFEEEYQKALRKSRFDKEVA